MRIIVKQPFGGLQAGQIVDDFSDHQRASIRQRHGMTDAEIDSMILDAELVVEETARRFAKDVTRTGRTRTAEHGT